MASLHLVFRKQARSCLRVCNMLMFTYVVVGYCGKLRIHCRLKVVSFFMIFFSQSFIFLTSIASGEPPIIAHNKIRICAISTHLPKSFSLLSPLSALICSIPVGTSKLQYANEILCYWAGVSCKKTRCSHNAFRAPRTGTKEIIAKTQSKNAVFLSSEPH